MKTKDRFLSDGDYNNSSKKKHDKFGNKSKEDTIVDKFGDSIRLGDFVQTTLKDGTILNECEVVDISKDHILTLVLNDRETTKEIHAGKVILLSI